MIAVNNNYEHERKITTFLARDLEMKWKIKVAVIDFKIKMAKKKPIGVGKNDYMYCGYV